MTLRPIPDAAISFLKEHEACVLHVYDDAQPSVTLTPLSDVRGTLTAGYGHTGYLRVGDPVDQQKADTWLMVDLQTAATRLSGTVSADAISALTDNQYAALLSFVFNLGANPGWTIWKRLNAKQFDQVPLEMMKFVNARQGGELVKVQGLVNRRAAEVALWSTDEPGSVPDLPPSSVTRAAETPPTPADPVPATKSAQIIAGAVAATAAVPSAIGQVTDAIQPYAHQSHVVGHIVVALATIAALATALTVVLAILHKKKARN